MLKRAFAVVMLLAVFACLAVPAWADVLWEPYGDDFYDNHFGDATYIGRMFYTNGDEGCVVAYTEPAGGKAVDVLPNGCEMYVSFTYKGSGGADWGVIQFAYDEDGAPVPDYGWANDARTGWVPMDSMWLIYDYQSFEEEYGDEFESFTGDTKEFIGKEIYCWEYPGSDSHYDPMLVSDFEGGMELSFSQTWTDEEGRLWGDMNYYYGIRNCWVCLSDPENDSLPTVQRGEPVELTPTDQAKVERGISGLSGYRGSNNLYIALALSLAVICAGGIAYILLRKKSEK